MPASCPRRRPGGLAVAVACAAALSSVPAAGAAWPGVNGRISFTQRVEAAGGVGANRDLFAVALDGTVSRLTGDRFNDQQSSWSADGLRLALKRVEEAWILNDLGGTRTPVQMTDDPGTTNPFSSQPAWSPDGRALLIRSNRTDPASRVGDIMRVDVDPASPAYRSITAVLARPGDQRYATYSPGRHADRLRGRPRRAGRHRGRGAPHDGSRRHGSRPAHARRRDRLGARVVARRDAAGLRVHTDGADRELYVLDLASGGVARLTDNDVHDEGPAWSPDGRLMAFTRAATPAAPGDPWVMQATGGEERALVSTPLYDESPDWQPLPAAIGTSGRPPEACGDPSLVRAARRPSWL